MVKRLLAVRTHMGTDLLWFSCVHSSPFSSTVYQCLMLFQMHEPACFICRIVLSSQVPYFCWTTLCYNLSPSKHKFHANFNRRASFTLLNWRIPNPPINFGWQIVSHAIMWINWCPSESPQKESLCNFSNTAVVFYMGAYKHSSHKLVLKRKLTGWVGHNLLWIAVCSSSPFVTGVHNQLWTGSLC